jgi:hypothetical protein
MSDPSDNAQASRPDSSEETKNQPLKSEAEPQHGNSDSADEADIDTPPPASTSEADKVSQPPLSAMPRAKATIPDRQGYPSAPLAMVETAFLASTASLIWLINYYFPLGPVLRMFFPVPIALVYLRWGNRASWMAALVSGLLLSVLMGPTRSILFFIPYGLMGVQLGALWRRQASWAILNFHRYAAWNCWILFSVLAALNPLGRRSLGLCDDSDYTIDRMGVRETGIASSAKSAFDSGDRCSDDHHQQCSLFIRCASGSLTHA